MNEVFATEVKASEQNTPEVTEAKERELANFVKFQAFEEVDDKNQPRITSRWVITRKEAHDGMKTRIKARLCMRGFQETANPQSDSSTISAEASKTLLAVSANEGFNLVTLDVTSAFLQGKEFKKALYAELPKEIKPP